jgi:hypothetical protein
MEQNTIGLEQFQLLMDSEKKQARIEKLKKSKPDYPKSTKNQLTFKTFQNLKKPQTSIPQSAKNFSILECKWRNSRIWMKQTRTALSNLTTNGF